jgi:hypothetical protein
MPQAGKTFQRTDTGRKLQTGLNPATPGRLLKLADRTDLGSVGATRASSSLAAPTPLARGPWPASAKDSA